ncbi:hypothetical protein IJJ02_02080 [Candidatus Saccharibacteria bacterium]|nr:hypothetical protein [Candidatus Saccharibacteria bacterium]
MDQNQTTENQPSSVDNDLQKAIDDIANNTNVDPVFSDPVAAPSSVPEGDTGELGEPVGPFPEPKVEMPTAPATEPIAPLESMNIPEINNFDANPAPTAEESSTVEETTVIEQPAVDTAPSSINTTEVKKAALRDLAPLISKININKSQKFNIYKDIFEELKDYTVLEPAYQAARELEDETERANALLYLVEAIDKM